QIVTRWPLDEQFANTSLYIFIKNEVENHLKTQDICAKSNDMKLFYFLTAGPQVIIDAPNPFLQTRIS
ncbi:22686_t:CDS:1, partial [Gigaspora margarita]